MSSMHIVYFWKENVFSNWHHSPFYQDGIKFDNNEQYMMWRKACLFNDHNIAKQLLVNSNPKVCKDLGRKVKEFNIEIWDKNCCKIVSDGLLLKFTQNLKLRNILLLTENKLLVEASPYDKIWGIGLDKDNAIRTPQEKWPGRNLLGKCLMYTRNTIKNNLNNKII